MRPLLREPSRPNDTNTISTVQETIEQLVSTAKGDITHDLINGKRKRRENAVIKIANV